MAGLHDRNVVTGRQRRVYKTWRSAHHGKWRYPRRSHAWIAVFRLWIADRELDWQLHPYQCRWGPDWREGAVHPVHYHIGHGSRYRPLPDRLRYWRNRTVTWPYCRARLAARILAGRAQAPPDWLPPGIYWARRTWCRWHKRRRAASRMSHAA